MSSPTWTRLERAKLSPTSIRNSFSKSLKIHQKKCCATCPAPTVHSTQTSPPKSWNVNRLPRYRSQAQTQHLPAAATICSNPRSMITWRCQRSKLANFPTRSPTEPLILSWRMTTFPSCTLIPLSCISRGRPPRDKPTVSSRTKAKVNPKTARQGIVRSPTTDRYRSIFLRRVGQATSARSGWNVKVQTRFLHQASPAARLEIVRMCSSRTR
uniref:(northern house mosquito) hypothetical protein n=1 Tax=Culex pipiens TaxID=7175 RepID=A0A8D8BID0_CULPI